MKKDIGGVRFEISDRQPNDSEDDDNRDLVNIIDIMADVDEYEDDSGDGDDTLML